MQIDWGWGAQQHYGREGQIKQSHSPYVSLSVSFTHTHINTHIYGQKDGGWIVATTCLTLSRLSATVSPTRADPSLLLPSSSRLYSEKVAVRVVPFFFFFGLFGIASFCFFPRCTMDFGYKLIFRCVGCFQEVGMLILALQSG